MMILRACAVAAALTMSGCSDLTSGGDCVALGVFGVNVTVIDALTNGAPTAVPSLRIQDGAFVEEYAQPAPRSNPPRFSGAAEREGTYAITVSADGYQTYRASNLRVTRSGKCNSLRGVNLTVKLTPN